VVTEATSNYWKPVFYLLEAAGFDTWLVNARDVKHLPGRPKTDKLDARRAALEDPRRGRAGAVGAAVHLSRHPRPDLRRAATLAEQDPLRDLLRQRARRDARPGRRPGRFPPRRTIDDVLRGWLLAIGSVTKSDRRDRSNARQAKRSLSHAAKPADPAKRPKRRGPLTLGMLPLAIESDPQS